MLRVYFVLWLFWRKHILFCCISIERIEIRWTTNLIQIVSSSKFFLYFLFIRFARFNREKSPSGCRSMFQSMCRFGVCARKVLGHYLSTIDSCFFFRYSWFDPTIKKIVFFFFHDWKSFTKTTRRREIFGWRWTDTFILHIWRRAVKSINLYTFVV